MKDGMPTNGCICPRCQAIYKTTDGHSDSCPGRPEIQRIQQLEKENVTLREQLVSRTHALSAAADGMQAQTEQLAELRATAERVEKWKESAGLARYYLESYSNDADMATHAKRVLDNALTALGEKT